MAEKKTEAKKVEKKAPAKKNTTKVNYMRPRGEKAKDMKVILNGKTYNIPYGEEVEVPIGVKEIMETSIAAMENAEIYEEEHTV